MRKSKRKQPKPYWTMDEWGEYLHTPDYNPEFNEKLKALVPDTERRWDRKERGWWISHGWLDEVDILLRGYYEDYSMVRD